MPVWLLTILEALAPTLLQAILDALKGKKAATAEVELDSKIAKYEAALNAIKA